MKPLYLSIEGINSFTERQEIFFDALFDGGLFCICGPTGSGKTTILDSIVLALYGKGGRGRLADYINLSASNGKVVFEFCSEEIVYRVERTFFRDSKPSKCILYDKTNSNVLADTVSVADQKLKHIIGLQREEFTQVALIEQGKFSEFLCADKSSRNATVGNLFRLDRYRGLYEKFNSKKAAIASVRETLLEQSKEYESISEENIAKIDEMLEAEKAQLIEAEQNSRHNQQEIARSQAVRAQWEAVKEAKKRLEDTQKKLDIAVCEFEALKKKLADIDVYAEEAERRRINAQNNNQFLGILDGLKHTYEQKKNMQGRIDALQNRLKKLSLERKTKEDAAKNHAQKLAELQQRLAEDIAEAQSIYKLPIEVNAKNEAEQARRQIEEDFEENIGLQKEHGLWQKQWDYSDLSLVIIRLQQRVSNVFSLRTQLIDKISNLETTIAQTQGELALTRTIWREAIAQSNRLRALLEQQSKQAVSLQGELRRAQIKDSAGYIRSNLQSGESCPVCGAIIAGETAPFAEGGAQEIERSLAETEAQIEQTRKDLAASDGAVTVACTNIEAGVRQLEEKAAALSQATAQLAELTVDVRDCDRLARLVEILNEITDMLSRAVKLESAQNEARSQMQMLGASIDEAEEELIKARKEILQANAVIMQKTGGEDLEELREKIAKSITADNDFAERFAKSRQATEAAIAQKQNQNAEILGEIKSIKQQSEQNIDFDIKAFESLGERQGQLEKRIIQLNKDIISHTIAAKTAREGLSKAQQLKAKIKEHTDNMDRLALILKIIKADRFLEFVAEEYIQRFTYLASNILSKISSGKYTLEYLDGIFFVRDFLMGNELRRASTLSGGETFLASLSLAIAITQEISGYKSFEFFFLDEGFGTLDGGSIEIVYEAIETLSKETLVGIVTHRSELVEKIPNRLTVLPATESSGSRVLQQ